MPSLVNGENYRLTSFFITKIWFSKFIQFDACGRLLFENPITYTVYIVLYSENMPYLLTVFQLGSICGIYIDEDIDQVYNYSSSMCTATLY